MLPGWGMPLAQLLDHLERLMFPTLTEQIGLARAAGCSAPFLLTRY